MKFPAFFDQLRSQRPQDIPQSTTTDKFLVLLLVHLGNLVESLQSQSIKNGKFRYELTGQARTYVAPNHLETAIEFNFFL